MTYIYPFFVGGYLLADKTDAVKSRRYLIAGLSLAAFAVLLLARGPIWRPDMGWVSHTAKTAAAFMHRTWHIRRSDQITNFIGPVFVRYASSFAAIIALTALYSGWSGRPHGLAGLARPAHAGHLRHPPDTAGGPLRPRRDQLDRDVRPLTEISIGLTLVLESIPVVRGLLLGQWKRPTAKRGPDGPEDEFAAEGDVPPEPRTRLRPHPCARRLRHTEPAGPSCVR